MAIKIFFIPMLLTSFSFNLNNYSCQPTKHKISVIGTAIVIKNDAAVLTDDSLIYYLDGVYDWDDEFLGKRVKVTGKLFIKKYHEVKNANPEITAIGQRQYGSRKFIKKPKWRLVK